MINPINHISFIQKSQKYRFDKHNQAVAFDNNVVVKVSGSNMSQALLAINNISFKQSYNTNLNINTITPVNKKNDDFLFETKYSFEAENLKDLYIAQYANDLIMLLTPSFHSEQSDITAFVPSNSNEKKQNFHTLIISASNEKTNNKNEIINKQQEVLKDLYDTNFEQTLNDIKEYSKQLIIEDDNLDEFEKQERINITNSINTMDVKFYIKKYLLDKKPMIEGMKRNDD
jgi:hypothetical protein